MKSFIIGWMLQPLQCSGLPYSDKLHNFLQLSCHESKKAKSKKFSTTAFTKIQIDETGRAKTKNTKTEPKSQQNQLKAPERFKLGISLASEKNMQIEH